MHFCYFQKFNPRPSEILLENIRHLFDICDSGDRKLFLCKMSREGTFLPQFNVNVNICEEFMLNCWGQKVLKSFESGIAGGINLCPVEEQ